MDKNILIQYSDMVEEVKDLRRRIRRIENKIGKLGEVSDSVKGTRKDGTIGSIRIEGFPYPDYDKLRKRLAARKEQLEEKEGELLEMVNAAESYINSVSDSRMRRILRHRYIDNLTWQQVAGVMGGKCTADGCRMEHDRFFKK